jgi:shikimate kinase
MFGHEKSLRTQSRLHTRHVLSVGGGCQSQEEKIRVLADSTHVAASVPDQSQEIEDADRVPEDTMTQLQSLSIFDWHHPSSIVDHLRY